MNTLYITYLISFWPVILHVWTWLLVGLADSETRRQLSNLQLRDVASEHLPVLGPNIMEPLRPAIRIHSHCLFPVIPVDIFLPRKLGRSISLRHEVLCQHVTAHDIRSLQRHSAPSMSVVRRAEKRESSQ